MTALVYNPETARSRGFGERVWDLQKVCWCAGRDTGPKDASGIRLFAAYDPNCFCGIWEHKGKSIFLSFSFISPISCHYEKSEENGIWNLCPFLLPTGGAWLILQHTGGLDVKLFALPRCVFGDENQGKGLNGNSAWLGMARADEIPAGHLSPSLEH